MAKFYTVEKKINGKNYKAQFNGMSVALRAIDESYISDNSSNTSSEKLAKFLFENVIVEPTNLTVDDFDNTDELSAVTEFAQEVMNGKLKPEEKGKKAD